MLHMVRIDQVAQLFRVTSSSTVKMSGISTTSVCDDDTLKIGQAYKEKKSSTGQESCPGVSPESCTLDKYHVVGPADPNHARIKWHEDRAKCVVRPAVACIMQESPLCYHCFAQRSFASFRMVVISSTRDQSQETHHERKSHHHWRIMKGGPNPPSYSKCTWSPHKDKAASLSRNIVIREQGQPCGGSPLDTRSVHPSVRPSVGRSAIDVGWLLRGKKRRYIMRSVSEVKLSEGDAERLEGVDGGTIIQMKSVISHLQRSRAKRERVQIIGVSSRVHAVRVFHAIYVVHGFSRLLSRRAIDVEG